MKYFWPKGNVEIEREIKQGGTERERLREWDSQNYWFIYNKHETKTWHPIAF